MSRRKVVKHFAFEEGNRYRLTFSDPSKIRLDPKLDQIQLARQGFHPVTRKPIYPLDAGLTVETWLTTPQAVRRWLGFSADPRPAKQPAGTIVQYKLNDGTTDLYWDGGAWSAAGPADWSPEEDVVVNIGTFPVTKALKVIVNLATADAEVTPTLKSVALLMDCEIDYLDSIIHDALIPSLKANLRPVLTFTVLADGGNKVSLLDLETSFDIKGVLRAFDEDSDPDHLFDIFSSYDDADRTITLSVSLERGTPIFFEYEIEPEVYLNWSSQDYTEVDKVPAVSIDRIDGTGSQIYGECSVKDVVNNEAVVLRFPFRLQLNIDIVLLAEKNRTLLKMQDRSLEYQAKVPLLPWPAIDEEIQMRTDVELQFRPRPNLGDAHSSSFSLILSDIHLWLRPEETIPLVTSCNVGVTRLQDYPSVDLVKTGQPC